MKVNEYMLNLHKKLMDTGVTESTASLYIRNLYNLNNKVPFKNLAFLKHYDLMESRMKAYALSTQKTMLGSILAVVKLFITKPTYKKVYNKYTEKLNGNVKEIESNTKIHTKNDKQKENWVSWEEVEEIKNALHDKCKEFKKHITARQYNTLLQFFTLSLYTDIPPRRNKDYQDCYIVKKYHDKLPDDRNYYSIQTHEFIFNKYKTSKTYGQQTINITNNEPMKEAMDLYLKYHPLKKGRMGKNTMYALLVKNDGSPLPSINSITRLLNKVFKKKIGASMLRHIYLSSKYGDTIENMKEDADAMGHSTEEAQNTYIKTDW